MMKMALTPAEIRDLPDPYGRIREARVTMDAHLAVIGELARIRRQAVLELIDQGVAVREIADRLGVTYEAVRRLKL